MNENKRYSPQELRAVLKEALNMPPPEQASGYTLQELELAAQEAGLDPQQLQQALRRVAQKKGRRASLLFVALGAAALSAALIFLPQSSLLGWRHGAVLLDNEQRQQAYTFEVLVLRQGSDTSCERALTAEASAYCLVDQVVLEPRTHTRVPLPRRPSACPQVWIRATSHAGAQRSATFTLPAAIEIDRHGRLDQKGLGHPNQHPAPRGELVAPARCAQRQDHGGDR